MKLSNSLDESTINCIFKKNENVDLGEWVYD